MNGHLKNSFLIVFGFFLSALILHSCGPKKQEPSSVEKRLLGTWEYAGYRVNGENWNDTAAKYGFNYPIKFQIFYDPKGLYIDHRQVGFVKDSSPKICIFIYNYSIKGNKIDINASYENSFYDPVTNVTSYIDCEAPKEQYNQKIPVFSDIPSESWQITFLNDSLKLSKKYNSNFYEWILKK